MQIQDLVTQLRSGQLVVVDPMQKGGVIVFKDRHYAEFAGPGAAIGGGFDLDCSGILPIGKLALTQAETYEERQRAYKTRSQWIRLIYQITGVPDPKQRARKILDQFEACFDPVTVSRLPNEALAPLVGVFPETIAQARHY